MAQGCFASTTMQIVTDNDFALFAGNDTDITRLIYQNDVVWNTQIEALSSFSFDLQAGENTFYLLAMGGGGEENVSGEINGVNIASIIALQSSNVADYLTGYNTAAVTDGSFSVNLSDAKIALTLAAWGDPTVTDSQTVVQQAGFGTGYTFDDSTAVFFKFTTTSVNVDSIPEPSTGGLLLLAGGGALLASRRRRTSCA